MMNDALSILEALISIVFKRNLAVKSVMNFTKYSIERLIVLKIVPNLVAECAQIQHNRRP